ncbi:outer membrane beta-barrel protein [Mesorhizobium sp. NBSH29]|uniref:outer membrane protein n=1 Tax=Mesorhizobium sp. NBSH29 TaxID=2654249 RepID=UPI00189669B6|nr:outer membrane protein [Mesorhizobium sp. NBSH29]QPC87337.1 outer membrane beta-barrel protein [Mesorhizobium sp. NBSH29]
MKANMKFARSTAAAFGLIALGMAPAFAADAVMEDAPVPAAPMEVAPINTWSGPYAGVTLGYGFSSRTEVGDPSLRIDTDGFLAHGFAGYQIENNGIVYGLEGDLGYGGYKGENAGIESKAGLDGSLRARLGVAVTPDVLIYGTAGGALQNIELRDQITGSNDSNTHLGWTAGVGTDVKITQQVFGRLEYRYTDLGSKDYAINGATVESDSRNHRVMFGLGMKF